MSRRRRDPDSVAERLGSKSVVKKARAGRSEPRPKRAASARPRRAEPKKEKAKPRRSSAPVGKKGPGLFARLFAPRPDEIEKRKKPVFREKSGPRKRMEAFAALPPARRIWIVGAALALFLTAVWIRVGQLQLLGAERFRARAEDQGTFEREVTGRRGRLLDRDRAELASTVDAESVFAIREEVRDPRTAARTLAPILGTSARALVRRLEGTGFAYLDRRVTPSMAAAVRSAKVPGVKLETEPKRMYGNVKLAAHVLGFVDGAGVGRTGLERTFDEQLSGTTAAIPGVRDARGWPAWTNGIGAGARTAGADLVLTLDRHVQFVAEEVLERTVEAHRARGAVAVVLDAATSEILALASYPTFNPNNLAGSTASDRKNRAIASIFDPGSTAKIVTIAAALESGAVRPETIVDCEDGQWRVGNRSIRDASHRYGELTVTEVMAKSSNIGAGKIGLLMGAETLHGYLSRFGFGARTGLELPGEVRGILRPAEDWREVDLVNIAFGQGVSVTPLQVAQAANVIAAGGVRRRPTLVRGVLRGGVVEPWAERTETRVVSKRTAQLVAEMMAGVTAEGGTAPKAAVPGFEVAGKTGTAQKYDPEIGAYSRRKYVASFVGFLPAEAPQVTVLVLVDEPGAGQIYGGQVAGPAFRELAVAALASKDLYPSDPEHLAAFEAEAPAKVDSTVREDPEAPARGDPEAALERAVAALPGAALARGAEGSGIDAQLSERARALLRGHSLPESPEAAPVSATAEGARMPDLRGLRSSEALAACARLALAPEVRGVGRVASQRPPPGARLRPGARCTLELRRDG